jgi:hypothetical protein
VSAWDVLARFGTLKLLGFLLALLVFVALHLARLPLLWAARLLEAAMSRVDHAITAAVSVSTSGVDAGTAGAGEGVR